MAGNLKAGIPELRGSFPYPADHAKIATYALPIAIVARRLDVQETWGWWGLGVGTRKFEIELLLFLEKGVVEYVTPQTAVIELRHMGWRQKVADVLAADLTLGGLVEYIGNGAQGENGLLFTSANTHIQWQNDVFWGIRFLIPITMRVYHEVS
jgi:hypothetical protein